MLAKQVLQFFEQIARVVAVPPGGGVVFHGVGRDWPERGCQQLGVLIRGVLGYRVEKGGDQILGTEGAAANAAEGHGGPHL